jgi:hypothetical protein
LEKDRKERKQDGEDTIVYIVLGLQNDKPVVILLFAKSWGLP